MKTGLFKWKPDHDGAAAEYAKAGKNTKFKGDNVTAISHVTSLHYNIWL
jgi:hypothetical protein